jgi:hypothetical protein
LSRENFNNYNKQESEAKRSKAKQSEAKRSKAKQSEANDRELLREYLHVDVLYTSETELKIC